MIINMYMWILIGADIYADPYYLAVTAGLFSQIQSNLNAQSEIIQRGLVY